MWSCSAEQLALHARDLDDGLSPSESWVPGFWFLYGTSYELLLLIMAFRNINLKMKYVKLLCPGLTSWKTLWPSLQWLRAGRSGEQIQTCERGNTPLQINIKILTMSFQMLSSSLSGFFCIWFDLTWHTITLQHPRTPQSFGRLFSQPITTWFGSRFWYPRDGGLPMLSQEPHQETSKMTEPTRIEKYVYSSHAINSIWKEDLCILFIIRVFL